MAHSVIEHVTNTIIQRSKKTRAAYVARMETKPVKSRQLFVRDAAVAVVWRMCMRRQAKQKSHSLSKPRPPISELSQGLQIC